VTAGSLCKATNAPWTPRAFSGELIRPGGARIVVERDRDPLAQVRERQLAPAADHSGNLADVRPGPLDRDDAQQAEEAGTALVHQAPEAITTRSNKGNAAATFGAAAG
jgi:hypothetical protein